MPTPHQLTKKVKLLHKIVVRHQNQILLLKRSPDSFYRPDKWDLPGGNTEWPQSTTDLSDSHLNDLTRELVEETSISVEPVAFDPNTPIFFRTYYEAERDVYTVMCGWLLDLTSEPEVKLSSEHTEFIWHDPQDLNSVDTGFDFIKDIITSSLN
jgi:8-oxo-dGTP pyrophosphatase MutT (NUDIX family)